MMAARAVGVAAGAQVRVQSRVGTVSVAVHLTDAMMRGVVSLPHGWGHGRKGVRLGVAASRPGVSMNDLTDPLALDEGCGNAVLNGVPVSVFSASDGAAIES